MPEKMNPEAKKEWLSDLRSGKFDQTQKALRSSIGFCCLGVLCETYRRVTGQGEWYGDAFHAGSVTDNDGNEIEDCQTGELPVAVSEWAGLTEAGDFPGQGVIFGDSGVKVARNLISLNDEAEWDFDRIADFIEERL